MRIQHLADIWSPGRPIRLTLLAKLSGLSADTLRRDREMGFLKTSRGRFPRSPEMVARPEARRWLTQIGASYQAIAS